MNVNRKDAPNRTRRVLLLGVVGALPALAVAPAVRAGVPLQVDEKEPGAQGLGYRADAANVDHAHFPRYAEGQDCGNCSFYHGRQSDPTAPCAMFSGRTVSERGWCAAYSKRT